MTVAVRERSKTGRVPLLDFSLDALSTDVTVRPGSFLVKASLGDVRLIDRATVGTAFPDILCVVPGVAARACARAGLALTRAPSGWSAHPPRTGPLCISVRESQPTAAALVAAEIEAHPLDAAVDMRFRLALQPVRAVISGPFFARVAQFFRPPPSGTVDALAVRALPPSRDWVSAPAPPLTLLPCDRRREEGAVAVPAPCAFLGERHRRPLGSGRPRSRRRPGPACSASWSSKRPSTLPLKRRRQSSCCPTSTSASRGMACDADRRMTVAAGRGSGVRGGGAVFARLSAAGVASVHTVDAAVLAVDLGTLKLTTSVVTAESTAYFRRLEGTRLTEDQMEELRLAHVRRTPAGEACRGRCVLTIASACGRGAHRPDRALMYDKYQVELRQLQVCAAARPAPLPSS